jgi:hypothetical protein
MKLTSVGNSFGNVNNLSVIPCMHNFGSEASIPSWPYICAVQQVAIATLRYVAICRWLAH